MQKIQSIRVYRMIKMFSSSFLLYHVLGNFHFVNEAKALKIFHVRTNVSPTSSRTPLQYLEEDKVDSALLLSLLKFLPAWSRSIYILLQIQHTGVTRSFPFMSFLQLFLQACLTVAVELGAILTTIFKIEFS